MNVHSLEAGLRRRTALAAAASLPAWLSGCSTPLPLTPAPSGSSDAALQRLRDSAEAHGQAAYTQVHDISVSYAGQWQPVVDKLQPELVDAGFRGSSQERLLPAAGVVAQAHTGVKGHKQVWWQRAGRAAGDLGTVAVWLNGAASTDAAILQTSALVAEGYGLFLLGPLWLLGRSFTAQAEAAVVTVNGRACDVLNLWLAPGLGRVAADRLVLYIDRSDGLVRRVRFTLEGFEGTQGAVAEVDAFDHQRHHGVMWPTRWFERLIRPLPLPVHDWHLTGLDINRHYSAQDLQGPAFSGAAVAPAAPL